MSREKECEYLEKYEGVVNKDSFVNIYNGMTGESYSSYEDLRNASMVTPWKNTNYDTSYVAIFLKLMVAYFETTKEEFIVMRHMDHVVIRRCLIQPELFYPEAKEKELYMTSNILPAMRQIATELKDKKLLESVLQREKIS